MVCPVRVGPDTVHRGVDKQGVYLVLFSNLLGFTLKEAKHLFNQSVFSHQGADWLHEDTSSTIHPLLQFLPNLEKRQFFCSHLSLGTSLWIPSRITTILPHGEAPESSDFNSATLLECIGETIQEHAHDLGCIFFSQVLFGG